MFFLNKSLKYYIIFIFQLSIIIHVGSTYELRTSIHALEVAPGQLIRINPDSKLPDFNKAAKDMNVQDICSHLVSIVAIPGFVNETKLRNMGGPITDAMRKNNKST